MNALNFSKNDSVELKGCPFCGSDELRIRGDHARWLVCDGCETEGPWGHSDEEAVERWNSRHEESPSEIERCMK